MRSKRCFRASCWLLWAAASLHGQSSGAAKTGGPDFTAALPGTEAISAIAESDSALPLRKLIDEPLRDISVVAGPDKWYYLTGSYSLDQESVRLWRSRDLQRWEPIGVVFRHKRAIQAPEIVYAKGTFWICFAERSGGTFLLRSRTKRVTGPYFFTGQITREGSHPSIFQEGESLYWVWDEGKVARLRPDGSALTGEPFVVRPKVFAAGTRQDANNSRSPIVGTHGAQLRKIQGRYVLFAAEYSLRGGVRSEDLFAAEAGSLEGPWGHRYLVAPNAGASGFFEDGQGHNWIAYAGGGEMALWQEGVGLLEVKHDGFWRANAGIIVEAGPLAISRPRIGVRLRDPHICKSPDHAYYLSTASTSKDASSSIRIFRSTDLRNWEDQDIVWRPTGAAGWSNDAKARVLSPRIYHFEGTFWVVFSLSTGAVGLLRSKSGLATGPYEITSDVPLVANGRTASLFHEEDGELYLIHSDGKLSKLNRQKSAVEGETISLLDANRNPIGREGSTMAKVNGRYVLTAAEWNGDEAVDGTYDLMVGVAENIAGPYSSRRVLAAHAGGGMLFADKDANWWLTYFGNDRSAPFREQLGILPISIQQTAGDLRLSATFAHPAPTPTAGTPTAGSAP